MRDRMEEHRRKSGLRRLPQADGSDRAGARELRRHRPLAHGGQRRAQSIAASQLADGTTIDGPAALRQAMLRRPDMFARNMTEMLLTYALGHGVEHHDMPFVRAILKDAARADYRFSSLVLGIVKSAPFQQEEIRVMMITKKAIPRRTVLRGLGATVALPLLDSMVPARDGAGRRRRPRRSSGSGSSTCRTARSCASGRRRRRARTSSSRRSSSRSSRSAKRRDGADQPLELRRERPLGQLRDVAERHVPVQGQPAEARDDGRSAHRARRSGSDIDVPVDGVRDRGSLEPPGQLRRRLPVLVHEHDQLGVADAAAADGDQPARRVRADVRRRPRHAGGAARAPGEEHQHPRRGARERATS